MATARLPKGTWDCATHMVHAHPQTPSVQNTSASATLATALTTNASWLSITFVMHSVNVVTKAPATRKRDNVSVRRVLQAISARNVTPQHHPKMSAMDLLKAPVALTEHVNARKATKGSCVKRVFRLMSIQSQRQVVPLSRLFRLLSLVCSFSTGCNHYTPTIMTRKRTTIVVSRAIAYPTPSINILLSHTCSTDVVVDSFHTTYANILLH